MKDNNMGFYFDPRQAKMSYEQALEYWKGKKFNNTDTINFYISNLFMTNIYTELKTSFEFEWWAV